ncbi:TPA: hypothetical protein ACRRXZ_003740 [Morganella morganii]
MSVEIKEIIEQENISIDALESVFKNSGMSIANKTEKTIGIRVSNINAIVSVSKVLIIAAVPFHLNDDYDESSLTHLISEINDKLLIAKISVINKNRLIFSIDYTTKPGVYIPHLISTMAALFASVRVAMKSEKLLEFIK